MSTHKKDYAVLLWDEQCTATVADNPQSQPSDSDRILRFVSSFRLLAKGVELPKECSLEVAPRRQLRFVPLHELQER